MPNQQQQSNSSGLHIYRQKKMTPHKKARTEMLIQAFCFSAENISVEALPNPAEATLSSLIILHET